MCKITTNVNGIPYIPNTAVQVSDTAVNIVLGFERIQQIGFIIIFLAKEIPSGTTTTLPVNITLNGNTRPLTVQGGDAATVEDVIGSGVLVIFNDRFNGVLQLV